MDLNFITENFVPVIVVACVLVGYIIKSTPVFAKVANNYIPLIVTVLGAILGAVMNGLTIEAIVYGAVSGLASTGLHQVFSQLLNINSDTSK
ncbi:MAG: phage holin family protein [Streptococcaceae bacterium]|nr:phage holin family protein [Streptococcaceae bacterium]